jgi:hypothetical protein
MIKPLVIVTSAIESRFGIYKPEQRLEMTLATIANLRERMPGVVIAISEVSGAGLQQKYEDALMDSCDYYFDWTKDKEVNFIYTNTGWYDNWDIVKNLTELTTFPKVLQAVIDNNIIEEHNIDRVFKMSGRYQLNEKFDIDLYETEACKNKVVIGKRYKSQFPFQVTLLSEQYMARLLSWPKELHKPMVTWYAVARDYMIQRMSAGGYSDIEHCLFYALPQDQVQEVDEVGVYGNIAPNGAPIIN